MRYNIHCAPTRHRPTRNQGIAHKWREQAAGSNRHAEGNAQLAILCEPRCPLRFKFLYGGTAHMHIQNSVIIITGASTGIGEATARLLAAKGAKLVLAARSAGKLETLATELRARDTEVLAMPTDITDQEAVKRLVQETVAHFGRIDALVNNAGVGLAGTVAAVDIAH